MLTVKRKSYERKAYRRKDGTLVSATKVPKSSFKIKDRGAEGRTPVSKRFYHPKTHTGWEATMPPEKRRRLTLKAHKGDKLATARGLLALSNVQHRINPEVSRKAQVDAQYFFTQHRKSK